MSNFLLRLNNSLSSKSFNARQMLPSTLPLNNTLQFGNEITLYPSDTGNVYFEKGFNMNDAVYSIVSKNYEKAGQVRFYHSKIKKDERKTLAEYNHLTKGVIGKQEAKEIRKMRVKMVEDLVVDSPLTRLLNKPNRYQTQSEWIENLFALREMQGEGNIWFNRGINNGRPVEMLIIPKPYLNLVGDGQDPFNLVRYQFNMNGNVYNWGKSDVVMWKYANPGTLSTTLEHMRGLAPLHSAMVLIQALNEGDKRIATSNANAGASAIAFRKNATEAPSPQQAMAIRQQFNDIVNNSDMAGKVAILSGEWGVHQLGLSIQEQQLLDQYGFGFKRLCRVWKTPVGIFSENNDTYENVKQYKRDWIYDKIAPNMYHLRDLLNTSLLSEFDLDPETNLIDADIMSLPELAEDLKDQIAAVKDAWWLTPNQKLSATGYEPSEDTNMDKVYVPTGLTTMEEINVPVDNSIDGDGGLLNNL